MESLSTERLFIRPFTMDDLDAAYLLLDLDLQWSGPGLTLEQRREKLQFYIALSQWGDTGKLYGYRAIFLKASDQLIGFCGFLPGLYTPDALSLFGQISLEGLAQYSSLVLEVGYGLATHMRGKGYAAEAVNALIEYGFQELRVRRIWAMTARRNPDSARLMRRVGMNVVENPAPVDYPGFVGMIENTL